MVIISAETMGKIFADEIPRNCKVAYAIFFCNYRKKKKLKKKCRIVVRGDIIEYRGLVSTIPADITTNNMFSTF